MPHKNIEIESDHSSQYLDFFAINNAGNWIKKRGRNIFTNLSYQQLQAKTKRQITHRYNAVLIVNVRPQTIVDSKRRNANTNSTSGAKTASDATIAPEIP